jgi:uncharacterized protein (DUF2062 family)
MHRRKLSRRGLRGGRLHAWLGDRILAKELWKPTRSGLARAWLIGFPITMIPFLPVQSLFACAIAVFLRANLVLCILLQFLSTPVTMVVHIPACYVVGKMLQGESPAQVYAEIGQDWRRAFARENVVPLYLGAAVLGLTGGIAGYGVINAWPSRRSRRRDPDPGRVDNPPPTAT